MITIINIRRCIMISKTVLTQALLLTGAISAIAGEQIKVGNHYSIEYVKYFAMGHGENHYATYGTGVIEGYVLFTGEKPPKNKRKLITKDKKVCGKGFKIDKVYIIGENKGVKNAVVYISDLKFKKPEESLLVQKGCEFKPRVLSMSAGSELVIRNDDPVKHEATGVQDFETIFKLSQHKQGMTDKVKLEKPGVVKITCSIHGWMIAWAVIPPNPFHSVTDGEGKFIIRDVPAGEYTLKLWHEGFGEKELKVKVQEGKTTHVKFEVQ